MASSYRSTPQTTNAARVSRVVMGPCTDLFRDILGHYIPQTDLHSKLTTFKLNVKPRLNREQRDILYPPNTVCTATYGDFDISLLYLLIRNMCGITPHSKGWGYPPASTDRSLSANIDRVREIRNKYCGHSPLISLSNPKFVQIWSELRQITQEIESQVAGRTTKYVNEMDALKTETMDPEQENHYLELVDKQKETLDNVIEDQKKQNLRQAEQEKTQLRQGAQLKTLQTSVSRQNRKIHGKQRKLENDQFNQRNKMRRMDETLSQVPIDQEATNILANTEKILRNHQLLTTYAETKCVKTALERLVETHIVIMSGKAGEGKTTASIQVMSLLSSDYIPVIIHQPYQWDKVINSDKKMIAFMDDVVGKTNFDPSRLESWQSVFPSVLSSAQNGNIYVIIGIRQDILKEVREHCSELPLFNKDFEINLSSNDHKLTREEKFAIIDKYEIFHKDTIIKMRHSFGYFEKIEMVGSDPYFGFPQICHLFFTRKEFFELGPAFFKHPNQSMFKDIDNLRKSKDHLERVGYCVLVYVFVYQQIDLGNSYTSCANFREITNEVRLDNVTDQDIKDAVGNLHGPYLSASDNENIYTFSHETVLEAVLLSFGQLSPDLVIHHCSESTLYELIRTQNYKKKSEEIVLKIPKTSYPVLVKKLFDVTEPFDSIEFDRFLDHPAIEDVEFASTIFSTQTQQYQKSIYWGLFSSALYHCKTECIKGVLRYFRPESDISCILSERDTDYTNNDTNTDEYANNQGYNIAHYIIFNGDSNILDLLLQSCPELLIRRNNTIPLTALELAVYLGKHEAVKQIWRAAGLCPRLRDYYMNTSTCATNQYSLVHTLMLGLRTVFFGSTFDANFYIDVDENVKLHIPCLAEDLYIYENESKNEKDYVETLEFLLSVNSSIITHVKIPVDKYGHNITHYCICYEHEMMFDMLLHLCSDVFHQRINTKLSTALHLALYLGRYKMVKKLWDAGVCQISDDQNPIDSTCTTNGYSLLYALMLGFRYCDIQDRTLFTDMDEKNRTLFTDVVEINELYPQCEASPEEDYILTLKFILSVIPSLSTDIYKPIDKYRQNIAHYVIIRKHDMMFGELLQLCPDIFRYRNDTTLPTALHLAVYLGRYEIVKELWNAGVYQTPYDKNIIESTSATNQYSLLYALMLGFRYSTSRFCYIDLEETDEIFPECQSSNEYGYIETLMFIISEIPSLLSDIYEPIDKYRNNIAHYIIIHDHGMMLDELLQLCPDVFCYRNDTTLPTSLHLAMYLGRYAIVKKLWNAGVRPIRTDENLIESTSATNQYSLIYALMLGFRYCNWTCTRYIDVDQTDKIYPICLSSSEKEYTETLKFILSEIPSLLTDIYKPIDKYRNNIAHYIIFFCHNMMFGELLQLCPDLFRHRNNTTLPTLLHFAAYLGRFEILQKLWNAGVHSKPDDENLVESTRATNQYSLLYAVMLGFRYCDKMTCTRYIDVDETDELLILLYRCAWFQREYGYIETLKFILSKIPSILTDIYKPIDRYKHTIVHYIIIKERYEMFDELLQLCPDIFRHRNNTALPTSLHLAVYLDRFEIVKKLWNAGVLLKPDDENLLESTCATNQYSLLYALMLGFRYCTGSSCTRYVDVAETNKLYPNNIYYSWNGYIETLKFILCKIPFLLTDIYKPIDKYGHNIVHYIIIKERNEVFDELLQLCPDVFRHRNDTVLPTSLHLAVYLGQYEMVKKLWNAGVRPTPDDENLLESTCATNQYSLLYALMLGFRYCTGSRCTRYIDVAETNELYPNTIYYSENSYIKTLKFILCEISFLLTDIYKPIDKYGHNIVHYIIIKERCEMFDELLQLCPDVFRHRNDTVLPTSLHLAVYLGQYEMVKKLWNAGVRPTPDDENLLESTCSTNQYSLLYAFMLGFRYDVMHFNHPKDNTVYACMHFNHPKDNTVYDVMHFNYPKDNTVCIDMECKNLLFPEIRLCFKKCDRMNTLKYILSVDPLVIRDLYLPLDTHGNSIVHYLVIHNRNDLFQFLFSNYQEIFHHRNNTNLPTALHVAVYLGRDGLVRDLLECGARPARDDKSLPDTLREGRRFSKDLHEYVEDKITGEHQWTGRNIGNSCTKSTHPDIQLRIIKNTLVQWGSKKQFATIQYLLENDTRK